jgi:electron transport complex protein RnfB
MSDQLFRELQQRLDQYSVGFPATESGIEIKILKKLFTPEDAELFLALSPVLESPETIAERTGQSPDALAKHLENMSRRGLLFRWQKGDAVKYGAIPFVHGLFEFQVKDLDRELALLVDEYFHEAFDKAMRKSAAAFLRTVPVNRTLEFLPQVASYEDARAMLRQVDKIVVTDCICRKQKDLVDQGCGAPSEVCFMFGSMGQYYLDRDMGRRVDVDEAISVLTAAQEAGLVTQPATAQNPGGMCNCCGDCCGVLRALNLHPKPAELVFTNHFAVVDADLCTACESCLDRCQMNAIALNDGDTAEVNLDRCIGCGLCVMACPTDAICLEPVPEEKRRVPPPSTRDQMFYMAQLRGLI